MEFPSYIFSWRRLRFLFVLNVIFVGTLLGVFFVYSQAKRESFIDEKYNNHNHVVTQISQYLDDTIQDLEFLVNIIEKDSGEITTESRDRIFSYMKFHKDFYQVRFLNDEGKEIYRVNQNEFGITIVPENELQDKSSRYYFKATKELDRDQIYISPLDLNEEKGKIEIPYRPVIRLAKPLFLDQELNYVFVINLNAKPILDILEQKQTYLVNERGYWVFSGGMFTDWGWQFDQDPSAYTDLDGLGQEIERFKMGEVSAGEKFALTPFSLGELVFYAGEDRLVFSSDELDDVWYLVSLPHSFFEETVWAEVKSVFIIIFLIGELVILVGGWIFFDFREAKRESILLLAENEKKIRHLAQFQSSVLNSSSFSIIGFNSVGEIIFWNTGAGKLLGWSSEEACDGLNILEIHSEDEIQEQLKSLQAESKTGKLEKIEALTSLVCDDGMISKEWEYKTKEGRVVPVDITLTPILNRNHQIKAYLAVARDLRSEKEQSAELLLSKRRLGIAIESAELGLWEWDLVKGTLNVSKKWYEIHDHPEDVSIPGLHGLMNKVPRKSRPEFLRELKTFLAPEGGEVLDISYQIIRSDESIVWVRSFGRILSRGEDGKATQLTGVVENITDQKEHEFALKEAKKTAEEANRTKSEFFANMSHEIRTPMNAIVGMTTLLGDTDLDPSQSDYVSVVRNSTESLLQIINDILDFSKIDAGKLELENHSFSVPECLEGCIEMFTEQLMKNKLQLFLDVDKDIPVSVIGDSTRFRQVVVNLISNAIKFTNQGHILVEAKLARVRGDSCDIIVAVKDTGLGISGDRVAQIFSPFTQEDGSITRRFGGTGLGLSISQRLVNLMGGDISVESKLGKGSAFIFNVIFGIDSIVSNSDSLEDFKGKKVFVLDDNPINVEIIEKTLRLQHAEVYTSCSVEDSLKKLSLIARMDCIIIDQQIREKDGIDFLREIRKSGIEEVPAIIASSVPIHDLDKLSEEINLKSFLLKPLRHSVLLKTIRSILNLDSQEEELNEKAIDYKFNLNILVAEDNLVNQKVIQLLLKKMGCKADIASNGIEAYLSMKRQSYDLILMDLQMPEMDGIEATQRIRNELKNQEVYIIGLSAYTQGDIVNKAIASGMQDYLMKPVRFDSLCESMMKAQQNLESKFL